MDLIGTVVSFAETSIRHIVIVNITVPSPVIVLLMIFIVDVSLHDWDGPIVLTESWQTQRRRMSLQSSEMRP